MPTGRREKQYTSIRTSLQVRSANTIKVYIHFTVEDTGRGLSEPEKQLLFARFSQASPRTHIHYGSLIALLEAQRTTDLRIGGSGLGLYISRRLTEMHGGAIGFSSKSGSGSTFSFYVKGRISSRDSRPKAGSIPSVTPALHAQTSFLSNRPKEEKSEDENNSSARRHSHDDESPNNLHVLIVEDNLVNQRVLAKQLRYLGMKVAVANHGGEALEYLRTTKFCTTGGKPSEHLSLILMDWEMPVMDGLTCVRKIRQLQKEGVVQGHVPVIAVTANVRSEQVKVATDAGMDDVVSKPFRIPELCERMRILLGTVKG
jgi:CheY-like chemotaxis protein